MNSRTKALPSEAAQPDLILLALFQSRLRERSLYLGEQIRQQQRRMSAHAQRQGHDDASEDQALQARLQRAEEALAAVQQAQERIGHGRYGLCDECQEPIGWDVLLEAPEQTVCPGCSRYGALDALRPGS